MNKEHGNQRNLERAKLEELLQKRVNTGFLPTPLHKLKRLSQSIGKAELFIKRDDLTGLAAGGNKLRKLDYIMHDALKQGCNTVLTFGGVQTNHGRLTAAAAAKFGLKSIIMVYGIPPLEISGNLLLDRILGSEVVFMDTTELRQEIAGKSYGEVVKAYQDFRESCVHSIVNSEVYAGDKIYEVPIGGHSIIGTYGYIAAVKEIMEQLTEMNECLDYLVVSNGSGGTFAGLWLGAKIFQAPFEVIGINVSSKSENETQHLVEHINEVAAHLGVEIRADIDDLCLYNDYIGEGYNVPDSETRKAIYKLAQLEGILVDPCYTGKGLRGFIDLVETEIIPNSKKAMFVHTGGTPGVNTKEHLEEFNKELWADPVVMRYKSEVKK